MYIHCYASNLLLLFVKLNRNNIGTKHVASTVETINKYKVTVGMPPEEKTLGRCVVRAVESIKPDLTGKGWEDVKGNERN